MTSKLKAKREERKIEAQSEKRFKLLTLVLRFSLYALR